MPKEPSYYEILGLQPDADAAAIDAAFRGRSLRFRVRQPSARGPEQTGPTQEQLEQAHAILNNPESRALYDAVYFPAKQPVKRRRGIPLWVYLISGVWALALLGALIFGLRSVSQGDGGAIGRVAGQTSTVVAAGTQGGGATVPPSGGVAATGGSPTLAAGLPLATATSSVSSSTATVTVAPAVATTVAPPAATSAMPTPTPTVTTGVVATPPPDSPTLAPTTTTAPSSPPPSSATVSPPPPSSPPPVPPPPPPPPATAVPPTVAPEPEPEPEPTATPSFRATDRIGTTLSVNLRSGPGAGYPSLGLLPTGTPLQATGETARVGGQLWRRFLLQDGRIGWVRDLDVLPAR